MKPTHTPGPWHLVSHRPNLIKVETARVVICDAFGGLSDETMSNAHLIASAPELLAALERLLESAEYLKEDSDSAHGYHGEPESFKIARAAIVKAKGQL